VERKALRGQWVNPDKAREKAKAAKAVSVKEEKTNNDKKLIQERRMIMPRGDATGPMGMGPMTGRGAGYCAGNNMPGYLSNAGGRGFGMGFGRGGGFGGRSGRGGGFGFRNRFYATGVPGRFAFGGLGAPYHNLDPETEKQALNYQADALQSEMDAIKKRLGDLEGKAKTK